MPVAWESPKLSRKEIAWVCVAGLLLAIVSHLPLILHLSRDIPKDLGDPLFQAWQLAWNGHALLHQPFDFFQANIFYPEANTLAFADALVGYAPFAVFAHGPAGALATHNVLFHVAYAMAFVGGYFLARELGVGPAGAVIAGLAFAFGPWRLEQDSRLNILSSGGIPLALFLGVRGYRQRRPRLVIAGWLVAAWQLTLGNNLGLELFYLLIVLGIIAIASRKRLQALIERPLVIATIIGVGAFGVVGALHSWPYLQVSREYGLERPAELVDFYSTAPISFLAAPEENLIWGDATAPIRARLNWEEEQTLFPGLAIVVLAIVGAVAGVYPRRLKIGLAIGTVAIAILSLGFSVDGSRLLQPYRLLYDYVPGWNSVRVPERLMTMTMLGLSLLAGAGAAAVLRKVGSRTVLVAALMGIVVFVEGSGYAIDRNGLVAPPHPTVPHIPEAQRGLPDPQLHLPAETGEESSPYFVLWSSDGFPKIVNGLGSLQPESYTRVQEETQGFPDAESIELLSSMGVRTVVLHPELAKGTPWENTAARSVDGLPVRREERGGLVIYFLDG